MSSVDLAHLQQERPELVKSVKHAIFQVEDLAFRVRHDTGRLLSGPAKKQLVLAIVKEIKILPDPIELFIVSALIDFLVFVIFNVDKKEQAAHARA